MRLRAKTQETAHTHQRDTALSDDSTATIKMLNSHTVSAVLMCASLLVLAICVCGGGGVCARADIILTAVGDLLFITRAPPFARISRSFCFLVCGCDGGGA
jgi:hypothetical protein